MLPFRPILSWPPDLPVLSWLDRGGLQLCSGCHPHQLHLGLCSTMVSIAIGSPVWVPCGCAGVLLHFGSMLRLGLQALEVEVEDMHTGESVEQKSTGDQETTLMKLTDQEAMVEMENRGTENTVNFRVKSKHKTKLGTCDRRSKSHI